MPQFLQCEQVLLHDWVETWQDSADSTTTHFHSIHYFTLYVCFVNKQWTLCKTSIWNISSHGSSSASDHDSKQLTGTPTTVPAEREWEHSAKQPHTCTNSLCHTWRIMAPIKAPSFIKYVLILIKADIVTFYTAIYCGTFAISIHHATLAQTVIEIVKMAVTPLIHYRASDSCPTSCSWNWENHCWQNLG